MDTTNDRAARAAAAKKAMRAADLDALLWTVITAVVIAGLLAVLWTSAIATLDHAEAHRTAAAAGQTLSH